MCVLPTRTTMAHTTNPRRLRLAYVTTLPQTQWAFLRGQNGYLAARGFELHAVASPGPSLARLVERDGVVAHPVPIARAISPLRDCVALARLFLVFRRIQPDIVHVSTPKAALLGAIAAWAARVPVRLFLMRGSITEPARGARRLLFRALERLTAALCHQTVCVAPSLLAFLRAERILGPTDGMVVASGMSNGIDVDRFCPARDGDAAPVWPLPALARAASDPQAVFVGFVGRLARDKGIEQIARAWERIREEFHGTQLLLVGAWDAEGPIASRWRAALERDPRVHLPGRVDDVVPYYRRMSLLLFPSHGTEGFPNVPMEAAAVGLPVIATRVLGCVDAVEDGVTGALIPPEDAGALTAAVRRYLADPALCRRQGAAGRARVEQRFRQQPIWHGLHAEYTRLVAAVARAASRPAIAEPASASEAS